jgi:serine/threonine-protein kinase
MSLKKLGRYELIRVLGKGAMGVVYEGRDPNLDRRVAIKTITVENLSEEATVEYEVRFRTEARSAARLQHPNIVSVYDSDRDLDIAYLVMEFIQGEDLKHHLDSGTRYSLEQTAGIMNDLLSALDYAHRQNIVHRDIKPANLLIEASGRIKLTDFGVARIQDSGDATRTQGTMVGTLKYMSPEQVQGIPIDSRSDLFAAGIVLYQLLTGNRPFEGASDFEIIQKIIALEAQPPSVFNPNLPREIDAVMARALEKSRDKRFPTASEFNAALQAAAKSATDPTMTPPASRPRPADSATWTSTLVKGESLLTTNPGSSSGVPASTVTQEVELVYWKEIKDSDDAEEFQDFLAKFPTGIYSDLARRRLKRLSSGGGGALSDSSSEADKTPAPEAADASGFEATHISTRPSGADKGSTDGPGPAGHAPARRGRGRALALAGAAIVAGIVIGVGFGYEWFTGNTAAQHAVTNPSAPETPKETLPKEVGNQAPTPQALTPPPPPEVPNPVTSKPHAKEVTAKVLADEKKAPSVPAPSKAPVASPEAQPAIGPDPTKECEGRILLGYETCMKDQCDKPKFAQHAICVERREMERRNRGAP